MLAIDSEKTALTKLFLPVSLLYIVVTYGVLLFTSRETIRFVAGKEMLLETLGAVFFLVASFLFFASAARCRKRQKNRNWTRYGFLMLAMFFLVAFGEEASWGQHYLGFSTPDFVERINNQGELNLHNLNVFDSNDQSGKKQGLGVVFNSNRFFDYFMILLFLILPTARRWWDGVRQWLVQKEVPVLPILFAVPLLLNYLASVGAYAWVHSQSTLDQLTYLAVGEIRESNSALLCLAMGIYFLLDSGNQKAPVSAPHQPPAGTLADALLTTKAKARPSAVQSASSIVREP